MNIDIAFIKFYQIVLPTRNNVNCKIHFLPCFPQTGVDVKAGTPFSVGLKGLNHILPSRASNMQPVGPSIDTSNGTNSIVLLGFPNAIAADLHSVIVLMR